MTSHFTKLLLVFSVLVGISFLSEAQTVEQIKASRQKYLWGEGSGTTLSKADNEALQMLISQISVQVESKFKHFVKEESSGEQDNYEFEEKVKSVVNTYSNSTLHNTERIVISNEPDAKVFRYIERENVEKVFENRKDKIYSFVDNANKAISENRIGDGLRYYYWAFTLLKSHPDCNKIRYEDKKGKNRLLISWIPIRLNEVFSNIDFRFAGKEKKETMKTVFLNVTYKGEPVSNLDYSYWDGRDWSNLINVKDGRGFLEYYGAAAKEKKKGRVKVEYIYETQANIDNELKTVIAKIDAIPFRKSYYEIRFDSTQKTEAPKKEEIKSGISKVSEPAEYRSALKKIQKAVTKKKYRSVKDHFTESGYKMFQKLIEYGNARIIPDSDKSFYQFKDEVMARSLPMSFSFENNHQKFVEDVVFHFNNNKKIKSLSFGLSKDALKSIIEKEVWKEVDRMVLINFLEHYKTAYALKRLDYIESIFADDALIITGEVVKVKPNADSRFQNNRIVKYNRQSKQEYIRNLKYSFQSKEYINIQFEESEIRKGGKGDNIYGIQIKQNYHSSNYGDQGYLFLMADLKDPGKPIIHVRTWQPAKGNMDSIYGLSDF